MIMIEIDGKFYCNSCKIEMTDFHCRNPYCSDYQHVHLFNFVDYIGDGQHLMRCILEDCGHMELKTK